MRIYFFIILFLYSSINYATNSINIKNAELSNVASQIQQLQKTILLNRQQQNDLEQQLQTTEIVIGTLSQQINKFNRSIIAEQKQLNQLKFSHELTTKQLTQQNNALFEQLRAAYKLCHIQPLNIILNQENANAIQRHLNYYRYLGQARLDLIAQIKQSLETLKTNMLAITQHQDNLKKLLEKKQNQQYQQQLAQTKRQDLFTTLHQSVQTKEQQLTSLLANQKALQDLITRLRAEAENGVTGEPFKQQTGKLHWPTKGSIMANFGSTLDVGDQRLPGVIINTPQDTPVHPIYPGKVIFASWLRGFGLLIIINHGNNYMSLYGRNHALYAKVGEHVSTNDVIALTGNSGGFEKSSLYFEIQNGTPINPNIWCR